MTPGMCRVRHQSRTIIWFASVTTTRHVIAIYVQTIKVLTILPLSPADRKEVLEAQNLIDTIKKHQIINTRVTLQNIYLTNNRSKINNTTELVMTRRLESTVPEAEVFHKMLVLQLLPLLEILLCELLLLDIQEQHHAPIHACMGMSSRHVLHNFCVFVCVCSHVRLSRQVHPIITTGSIENHLKSSCSGF